MAAPCTSGSGLGLAAGLEPSLKVLIRFNASQSYEVDVSLKDSIASVKQKLAAVSQTPAGHINLVLAGQIMGDHRLVEEFSLGSYTTLHAFCWADDSAVPVRGQPKPPPPGPQISLIDQGTSNVDSQTQGQGDQEVPERSPPSNGRQRFFVFCKLCDGVRPGKLRVMCAVCESGAFLVTRGPDSWRDISPHTDISGQCQECHATRPHFYMRCSAGHPGGEGAVVLRHVQGNHRRVDCIICGDIMSVILIFPCPDGHVICLQCFRQYGASSLSERRFTAHREYGYTLPCPAGCEGTYIEETHHFLVMGKDRYERYKNFAAEEFVLQNGGLLCPAPGCGMGLLPEGGGRELTCHACQQTICRECLREFHYGDCEEYQTATLTNLNGLTVSEERAQRASWEQRSHAVIEETTRACPGCRTKTEKSGGCQHMTCPRCRMDWCWMCRKPWTRDCQADHWFT